jgi:hypothetical protein
VSIYDRRSKLKKDRPSFQTRFVSAAQENINILRERASADDLLERANHSHLEYNQAALALRRLFQPPEHQRATPQTPTSANHMLRSDNDDNNIHGILARLRADIIHRNP